MKAFGYISEGKIIAPVALRSRFNGVGAWNLLSDVDRAEHGWYPCEVINYDFDNVRQVRAAHPTLSYDASRKLITCEYSISDKRIEIVAREQKERVTKSRYDAEISGVELNGEIIETDRTSQTRIAQAHALVQLDPSTTIDWKCGNGWIVLDSEIITQIALAIGKHVQGCFTKEMQLHKLIDEAETIDDVLKIEW